MKVEKSFFSASNLPVWVFLWDSKLCLNPKDFKQMSHWNFLMLLC